LSKVSSKFAVVHKCCMSLFFRKILLVVFGALALLHADGQVNVSQEISPAQINIDQYATLRIVIENSDNVQQVSPPSLKDFMVVSGPNQESGMSSVNGAVKRFTALSFVLKPKQTGKINIGAATVNIGGKAYKTNSSSLLVKNETSPAGSNNSMKGGMFPNMDPFAERRPASDFNDYILHKGEHVADKVSKNMQLKLETNKTSCYVGEPIIATYKLYTRLKSESRLTQNPSFNGFSVIDLTKPDGSYTREKLNGREYNVYTIRKAQLYPLQEGNIELEAAELENSIQFIKDDYVVKRNSMNDLFDDFAGASVPPEGIIQQTVSLQSKPVSILVKPLPEANKPANFNGAVGNFSIVAQLQKNEFPANEAGKLVVKISGNGNLQLLTAPVLQWPGAVDPFEPKSTENLDKMQVPVSGNKIFEYSFSANKPGNYELPAIQFSYFDPASGTYKMISTKPFPFTVTKATGPVASSAVPEIKRESASGINKIFNNRWWIIIFIALAMFTGLVIWVRKDHSNPEQVPVKPVPVTTETKALEAIVETSAINQQNPLLKTEECMEHDDCAGFYSLLNSEMKQYLAHKFSVTPAEINTRTIASIMDKRNMSNETSLQLQELLQQIEWQLYTPFERNEKMLELYQQAQLIIQLINSNDIRHL